MSELRFDRITYTCKQGHSGHIAAVLVNLTRIVLEGVCPTCDARSLHEIDLLQVDQWMAGEVGSPFVVESRATSDA